MSLKELRDRITHALQTIAAHMLHRVWDEFIYRLDACRVTQGAHIEGLWLTHEKLGQLPLLKVLFNSSCISTYLAQSHSLCDSSIWPFIDDMFQSVLSYPS